MRALTSLLVGLVVATPAMAQSSADHEGPHHNCYCRARGQLFSEGTTICLRTGDGPRLARCVMEQNVTSWRTSSEPCPES